MVVVVVVVLVLLLLPWVVVRVTVVLTRALVLVMAIVVAMATASTMCFYSSNTSKAVARTRQSSSREHVKRCREIRPNSDGTSKAIKQGL